jgi:hypothetical protein
MMSGPLEVELIYSADDWFAGADGASPTPGGYHAQLVGSGLCGHGRTAEAALGDLARELRLMVESWDDGADLYDYREQRQAQDRLQHHEEPELVALVRPLLRDQSLTNALRMVAAEPVIHACEDPCG